MEEIKVVSFDIFDTLVLRLVRKPEDVFAMMYEKNRECLGKYFTRNRWVAFRKEMEQSARREAEQNGRQEITISEIYDQGKKVFPWIDGLIEKEFECECDVCFLNPQVLERMKTFKNDGKRIILLSDMYWTLPYMHRLLERCGFELEMIEKLCVSSEYGVSKFQGDLYGAVLKELGIRPEEWLHFGDNDHADYRQAKSNGVRAELYGLVSQAKIRYPFLDMEQYDSGVKNMLPVRLLAGAGGDKENDSDRFWYTAGAMIYGPLIVGAAEKAIDTACKEGIKQIFPLMREGYFFAELLQKIAGQKDCQIKIMPLYVSRSALKNALESDAEGMKAVQYFKQMGLEQPFLTFDVGYGGTIGVYIDRLLQKYGVTGRGVHYLVIERGRAVPFIMEGHDIRGYVCAEKSGEEQECREVFSWIFEMAFMCEKGTTTGYKKEGSRVAPVLQDINYHNPRNLQDARMCQTGILRFCEQYLKLKQQKLNVKMDAAGSYQLVVRLFCSPLMQEAFYLKEVEYDENLGDCFFWKAMDEDALIRFQEKGFTSFLSWREKRPAEWIAGMKALSYPYYYYDALLHMSLEYEMQECLVLLEKYLQHIGGGGFLLVGFGDWGKKILQILSAVNCLEQVEAVVDNNQNMHGLRICGKEVTGLESSFSANRYLITILNPEGIDRLEWQIKSLKGDDAEICALWRD